jgi:hypothetical protein
MSNATTPAWANPTQPAYSGHFLTMPEAEYRAEQRLSASTLEHFINGPDYFHARQTGAIVDGDSPAMRLGRALHCYVLEGLEAFDARYLVSDGPINERTCKPYGRETKAFAEWEAANLEYLELLTNHEFSEVTAMAAAVQGHRYAVQLLGDTVREQAIFATFNGVPVKGRLDAVNFRNGLIVDLKTISEVEKLDYSFERYARQLAFYRRLVYEACGSYYDAYLIAVDKTPLHRCRVLQAMPSTLLEADERIDDALEDYSRRLATGDWPSPYASEIGVF